ncbi:MAG TPA: hypothetical protein VHZ76_03625 [Gammaproteobacteria bacterium]|jgi:hypothetical protein|nr:hypothetical protein [Gammaproteobacteria bacterium]
MPAKAFLTKTTNAVLKKQLLTCAQHLMLPAKIKTALVHRIEKTTLPAGERGKDLACAILFQPFLGNMRPGSDFRTEKNKQVFHVFEQEALEHRTDLFHATKTTPHTRNSRSKKG